MSDTSFETETTTARDDERLIVDVDGFEGPLDLLLELARGQKVDLHKISVLALAEQYLAFIETARAIRLELAADYLVMAAWLAYLKSRLLLPRPAAAADEPEAGDLAAALAERLRRLEIIRAAARALDTRPRVGRDIALRGGADDAILDGGTPVWTAAIYDLMAAYCRQRQKRALLHMTVKKRAVWPLADARAALQRLTGLAQDWSVLDEFLLAFCSTPAMRRTVRASAFSVALEMVREGDLALRQDRAFAPLWVKARGQGTEAH